MKKNNSPSMYWHDYETFGANPSQDRPAQFAGIRTDEDLNIISDPLMIYCKPADDMLPAPEACLITGITPQEALKKGVCEAEFIKKIHHELSRPNTCVVGYNNIRFDDEVTRYTLYRNFYDPYAREWQNGNSRWDIIDMVRLTRALRPEGINWPNYDDGIPCFKLEEISKANGVLHESAHDALSDVIATIEVAKLIKNAQPKLYSYIYSLRNKHKISQLLDTKLKTPVVHVSSRYPSTIGCLALVAPVAMHQTNKNAVIVYDLREDPDEMLKLSAEEIYSRVFVSNEELEATGEKRIPLKLIHINKCPIVVPENVMSDQQAEKYSIDKDQAYRNLEKIKNASGIEAKLQQVFAMSSFADSNDVDQQLYSGFFSPDDKRKMDLVRGMTKDQLQGFETIYDDKRIPEMLFRYRARNYPESLTPDELSRWNEFRISRITDPSFGSPVVYDDYVKRIDELLADESDQEKVSILRQLQQYGDELLANLNVSG